MRARAFRQVDVFTAVPFMGNPVAVVLDADGLSVAAMQRIARWTNLSETTFVLPPTRAAADYRLRIFTPMAELPFAGHPTLGSAHALLEAGRMSPRDGELVQECGAGLVRLTVTKEGAARWIAFELPPASLQAPGDAEVAELSSLLGAALVAEARPLLVDVGPRWLVAQLPDAAAVLALQPDRARLVALSRALGATGVTVFGEYAPGEPARLEVRSFAPAQGIDEDLVCGSGNGAVGVFLRATGQVDRVGERLVASQGLRLGRAGRLRLVLEGNAVRVGGQAVTCVEGVMPA
jgi:PhzF family phenazine biosynthesis protein